MSMIASPRLVSRHAPTERPSDDPLLQCLLGELESTAYIARAAILDAADAIAEADASARGGVPDAKLAAAAQLKAAKVKVHLDRVAPEAILTLALASIALLAMSFVDVSWRGRRSHPDLLDRG